MNKKKSSVRPTFLKNKIMQKEESGQATARKTENTENNENERQKKGGTRGSEQNDWRHSEELGTNAIADNLPKGDPDKDSQRLQ